MTTLADGIASPGGAARAGSTGVVAAPPVAQKGAAAPEHAAGLRLFGAHRGSGYRVPPSLVQRADGQVVQLTPLLYSVLRAVDGSRTEDEIAAAVSAQAGRLVVAEDVHTLIGRQLRPLGLLKRADGSEPAVRKANPLLALRFRVVVSNPERTRWLTAPFAALFHPVAVVGITAGFAAVTYWVLFRKGLASAASEAFARPGMLLAVFAVTVASAGFHEFGHAAALRRGGGTPGAMGAGLYMVWPAFYTDVTDSYRLSRGSRLRTDLGGLYFNALLALATFGIWTVVRWDGLLLVIATQILQMIRQLPPLLRFDGYHVLADLTGVPDLYHRIGSTLAGLWPTRWRSRQSRALKPWARAVVTLWVLLVAPLLLLTALVMIVTLPRIIASAAHSLTVQWGQLTDRWGHGEWAGVGVKVLALIAVALPVLGVGYLLARILRQVVRGTLRRTKGKPGQRAVAAVAAVAVIAGLVWAWWPRGNYRPIQPNERGVVQQAIAAPAAMRSYFTFTRPTSPARSTAAHSSTAGYPPVQPGAPTTGHPRLRPGSQMTATSVWPPDDTQRPSRQQPQLAIVLIPRNPAGPTWVFPFNRPSPPGPGDNQSMAIATRDGSITYDVAFALVTATSDTVLNSNEAYAFASCSHCAAVAVSFQVVLIVGDAHAIAPKNVSAAVSYNCISCLTAALAIQLDLSLSAAPAGSTAAQLAALWTQISSFGHHITSYSLAEVRAQLQHYEQQIEQILQPLTPTSRTSAVLIPGPSGSTATSSPSPPDSSSAATGTAGTGGIGAPSTPPSPTPPSSGSSPPPPTSPPDTGSPSSDSPGDTAAPSSNPTPTPGP
jgi:putative peptide zinc metalloprotease protein